MIGQLVTDEELEAFVQGFAEAPDTLKTLLVRGVEAKIIRKTGQSLISTAIADEEITIEPPIVKDGFVIRDTRSFRVQYSPVSVWASLKAVTSRNPSTGAAGSYDTVERGSYHVELQTGIVRLIHGAMLHPFDVYPNGAFPVGTKILLASYTAGLAASAPYDLKLLALKIIARLFLQQQKNRFGVDSISFGETTTTFLNVEFTNDEEGDLRMFRRPYFA